jgi:hypothetical protein
MGCLGLHFALNDEEVRSFLSLRHDEARPNYLYEELEEEFWGANPDLVAETDKAWDGIHRALTDGHLDFNHGPYPMSHVIMGGERVYFRDDHIMVLKTSQQVRDVAGALPGIEKQQFRAAYFQIDPNECGYPINVTDFDYTWTWFESLRRFWLNAAVRDRSVLFSASQ